MHVGLVGEYLLCVPSFSRSVYKSVNGKPRLFKLLMGFWSVFSLAAFENKKVNVLSNRMEQFLQLSSVPKKSGWVYTEETS